jgi:hypothetical protein
MVPARYKTAAHRPAFEQTANQHCFGVCFDVVLWYAHLYVSYHTRVAASIVVSIVSAKAVVSSIWLDKPAITVIITTIPSQASKPEIK